MTAIPETRYTTVGDDRVAYHVMGGGPHDVVFTLGMWGLGDRLSEQPAMARFLRRLASFSRLIMFDPRGAGLSDHRPQDGREPWEHWAEDLLAVMTATHSKSVNLLGSLNAELPLWFAARFPERCSRLILVNPSACTRVAPDYPEGISTEILANYLGFTAKHYGTDRWTLLLNPSLAQDEEAKRWFSKLVRTFHSPKETIQLQKVLLAQDMRKDLPLIQAPALIMARRDCRVIPPAQGRYVAAHIPGARFIELPGSDLWMIWETPDLILDHIEEFITGQRHGGEPDRMLTTVLFTDIVGSTAQAATLGDAAWRALLDRHDSILREQIGLFGGKVADHSGDGSLSTFANPRRAIECALAVHKALAEIGVEIRAGVHFGEVEKRADGGISGVSVHVGARVMALAGAGDVLVSGTLRQILIGSRYEFDDRGTHTLKGVPGEWRLFAVSP